MGMVKGDLKLFFKQWTFLSNSLVDKISCKLFETVVLIAPVRNFILAGGCLSKYFQTGTIKCALNESNQSTCRDLYEITLYYFMFFKSTTD